MLIEHTFDLSSSKASAEGHGRLEDAKITVLTYEQGEAMDPVESQKFESARRVEVEHCLIPAMVPSNTDSAQLAKNSGRCRWKVFESQMAISVRPRVME